MARENRGNFVAIYLAKVRITVFAGGTSIVREGHGTGDSRGEAPGEVHDTALKAAETDATKRALATFGKPFGLELYRAAKPASVEAPSPALPFAANPNPPVGFHPDDTTPIPRPSKYYGRRQSQLEVDRSDTRNRRSNHDASHGLPVSKESPTLLPGRIDKSVLTIGEPKRLRDKAHLRFVTTQPCLICGRQPSDPHHLRFAQPRAIGLKVSDEFTVPLCRGHHRQLHETGNEAAWWEDLNINALEIARGLWEQTHPNLAPTKTEIEVPPAPAKANP
jgi:hypothetical protein